MKIRYEVDEANVVRAWNDDLVQTEPFLLQPYNQDGTPFADKAEAEAWAAAWFAEFTASVAE